MLAMNTTTNAYLDSLLRGYSLAPAGPLGWVNDLRRRALERAHQLTVPSTRDEAWRFTDLSPLYRLAFKPARDDAAMVHAARLAPYMLPEAGTALVFVDGFFVPALSTLGASTGVTVTNLASAMQTQPELVRGTLGALAGIDEDAFRAINAAYFHDGALIHVGRNQVAPAPIHLLFASSRGEVATHPRVLVQLDAGASATVVEDFVALDAKVYCVNAVSEFNVGQGAQLKHVRMQRESAEAFHIATCAVKVARDARYESVSIALGARISRLALAVEQAGEGAYLGLDGLALIRDRQVADTHSFIDHAKPQGTSRQHHKCVVGGSAHGVFNGRILVRPDAQLTDSAQSSRNLLLSPRAHVDTKPQLEIFADDVKAAHGATIGQLDAEELFYLQTRGLPEATARGLLTYGFAAEIADRIPVASIAKALRKTLLEHTFTQS